jgi:hypothetical protein
MHRARAARPRAFDNLSSQDPNGDVAARILNLVHVLLVVARRDHRKSKFGLRHDTNLIELYVMTKSEF